MMKISYIFVIFLFISVLVFSSVAFSQSTSISSVLSLNQSTTFTNPSTGATYNIILIGVTTSGSINVALVIINGQLYNLYSGSPIQLADGTWFGATNVLTTGTATIYLSTTAQTTISTTSTTTSAPYCSSNYNSVFSPTSVCNDNSGSYQQHCQDSNTVVYYYCGGTWNGSIWLTHFCAPATFRCSNGCSNGACLTTTISITQTNTTTTSSTTAITQSTQSSTQTTSTTQTSTSIATTSNECSGIVCDGLCYTAPFSYACINNQFYQALHPLSQVCTTDADCGNGWICQQNHMCNNGQGKFSVTMTYPINVAKNTAFTLGLTIENTLNSPITLKDFANGGRLAFDSCQSLTLFPQNNPPCIYEPLNLGNLSFQPFEKKTLSFTVNSGPPTMIGKITLTLDFPDNAIESKNIIVYDASMQTAVCGTKTYNSQYALCLNNVLYPIGPNLQACTSNSNCVKQYTGEQGSCIQHICFYPSNYVFKTDKQYNVAIVPLYLSSDSNEIQQQTSTANQNLQDAVNTLNQWTVTEIAYWKTTSPFNVKFSMISCVGNGRNYFIQDSNMDQVAKDCQIDRTTYPLVVFSLVWPNTIDDSLKTAANQKGIPTSLGSVGATVGLNLGTTALVGYQSLSDIKLFAEILHETLHSFGEIDLYYWPYNEVWAAQYELNNCLLYAGQSKIGYFATYQPHLCKFEASIIGWSFVTPPTATTISTTTSTPTPVTSTSTNTISTSSSTYTIPTCNSGYVYSNSVGSCVRGATSFDPAKLLDIAFKLQSSKSQFDSLSIQSQQISDYYRSQGNLDKANKWQSISQGFISLSTDVSNIANYLISNKDSLNDNVMENARSMVVDLNNKLNALAISALQAVA